MDRFKRTTKAATDQMTKIDDMITAKTKPAQTARFVVVTLAVVGFLAIDRKLTDVVTEHLLAPEVNDVM